MDAMRRLPGSGQHEVSIQGPSPNAANLHTEEKNVALFIYGTASY